MFSENSGNLEGLELMTLICLEVSCFIMVFMLFFFDPAKYYSQMGSVFDLFALLS